MHLDCRKRKEKKKSGTVLGTLVTATTAIVGRRAARYAPGRLLGLWFTSG